MGGINTNTAPSVPVEQFKRVKIVATVGPATDNYESVLALIKAGVNGIRLNFSHGTNEERTEQIKWIRKASEELGKPVAIIQDLQGPKIRLGDFSGVIPVKKGQELVLKYQANYERDNAIPTQYDLSKKVKRGERLYLFDGRVKTIVTTVGKNGAVHARAENDGILIKRKGLNLPDTDFDGDTITEKDKKDLTFASSLDVDFVAQSFVQTSRDVQNMRTLIKRLGMNVKIMAKFETKSAVDNLESIVQEADAIMIARGDLAVEAPAESVPIVQRKLVALGLKYAKPTVVATQMLFSMTEQPEPTRAEVSDVATAVIMGADAVMLSDETASGKHPVESVETMKRIILYTQAHSPHKAIYPDILDKSSRQSAICNAIIHLAEEVKARAIVAETRSGATATQLAARRSNKPIIAVTSDVRVAQQLAINYGTKSYVRKDEQYQATKLTNWLQKNRILNKGDMVVTASGQYPGVVGTTDTIKVRHIN
jgi:pyruvate kinase